MSTMATDCFFSSSRETTMALKVSDMSNSLNLRLGNGPRPCLSSAPVVPRAPPDKRFLEQHQPGSDGEERIGQIEDGEGLVAEEKQKIGNHMAEHGPIVEIAERAADDEGEVGLREAVTGGN